MIIDSKRITALYHLKFCLDAVNENIMRAYNINEINIKIILKKYKKRLDLFARSEHAFILNDESFKQIKKEFVCELLANVARKKHYN